MRRTCTRNLPLLALLALSLITLLASSCSRTVPVEEGPERMLPQIDDHATPPEGSELAQHEALDPTEDVAPPAHELPHEGNPPSAAPGDIDEIVSVDARAAVIGRFGGGACETNEDCRVAGCNSELCVNAEHGGMSTCDMRPEYGCFRPPTTGCACIEGTCGWVPTPALVSCMDEAGAFEHLEQE